MRAFKIRNLQKEDIEVITKMMLKFPGSYPANYVNSGKRGGILWLLEYVLSPQDKYDARSFILEEDDQIVGHIAYMSDVRSFECDVYELRALVVDKERQGKDYGKQLFKHAETELQKIKARIIWFQTGKEEVPYYEKLGYEFLFEWKDYFGAGQHRYIMERKLRS